MQKKERVKAAILGDEVDHIPVGMSLHFSQEAAYGPKAVDAHLDFYAQTDTDIAKIMNENIIPDVGEIREPEDWNKIPIYTLGEEFMQRQIELVQNIIEKANSEMYLLGTIHGICASAIHPIEARYGYEAVRELQCSHLRKNKKPMLAAFGRIADAMCLLVEKYKELGVNGIYYAALGGESRYFTDEEFAEAIEPYDKKIINTAKQAGLDVFLHICKDGINMQRYASYNKNCDVVNWGVHETCFSLMQGRQLFEGTAIMGGLHNCGGPLVDGDVDCLQSEVSRIIQAIGKKSFILGADCTLPSNTPYSRIKAVVDAARKT